MGVELMIGRMKMIHRRRILFVLSSLIFEFRLLLLLLAEEVAAESFVGGLTSVLRRRERRSDVSIARSKNQNESPKDAMNLHQPSSPTQHGLSLDSLGLSRAVRDI